jgi:hypothetical protein
MNLSIILELAALAVACAIAIRWILTTRPVNTKIPGT